MLSVQCARDAWAGEPVPSSSDSSARYGLVRMVIPACAGMMHRSNSWKSEEGLQPAAHAQQVLRKQGPTCAGLHHMAVELQLHVALHRHGCTDVDGQQHAFTHVGLQVHRRSQQLEGVGVAGGVVEQQGVRGGLRAAEGDLQVAVVAVTVVEQG